MTAKFIVLTTLALSSTTLAQVLEVRAQKIPQFHALNSRANYNGGWAMGIEGSSCPSDVPVACDRNGGYVNPTCCPKDQVCYGYASPYCCTGSTDCLNVVTNFPVCALPSWSLYLYNANRDLYFCCPPGQIGILPSSGNAGICKPADTVVASSLIASPISAAAAATGTASTGVRTSTIRETRTSTLSGGGVTLVTEVVGATVVAKPTSSSSSSSGSEDTGSDSSSSSSSSSSSGKKKSKIGVGAIAGIAIGGIFSLLALVASLWWRRARKNKQNAQNIGEVQSVGYGLGNGTVAPAPIYAEKSPAVSYAQGVQNVNGTGGDGLTTPGYAGPPPPAPVPQPQQVGYGGPQPAEVPASGNYQAGRVEMGDGRQ